MKIDLQLLYQVCFGLDRLDTVGLFLVLADEVRHLVDPALDEGVVLLFDINIALIVPLGFGQGLLEAEFDQLLVGFCLLLVFCFNVTTSLDLRKLSLNFFELRLGILVLQTLLALLG